MHMILFGWESEMVWVERDRGMGWRQRGVGVAYWRGLDR